LGASVASGGVHWLIDASQWMEYWEMTVVATRIRHEISHLSAKTTKEILLATTARPIKRVRKSVERLLVDAPCGSALNRVRMEINLLDICADAGAASMTTVGPRTLYQSFETHLTLSSWQRLLQPKLPA
jgi:hypothetical protein